MKGLPYFDAVVARAVQRPRDLGHGPGDSARLLESPILRHLGRALPPGHREATAADLAGSGLPRFLQAPHPDELLTAPERPKLNSPEGAAALRVLSYNCALLDRPYLGTRVTMPFYRERAPELPARLLNADWDVLLLQEVWENHDASRFVDLGKDLGFRVFPGSERHHPEHGLLICIREALISKQSHVSTAEGPYRARYAFEEAPGPGIRRAWQSVRFPHAPSGRMLTLLNTHMTAFPEFWRQRALQSRTLGLVARRAPPDDVVIVGGDMNSGPFYARSSHEQPSGRTVTDWWQNASAYPLLLHYGQLQDALVCAGRAQDIADAKRWTRTGDNQGESFTATDANGLHATTYLGTEQPGRLDHLLFRDARASTAVHEARVVLRERKDFGVGPPIEASDHYGVEAELRIALPTT